MKFINYRTYIIILMLSVFTFTQTALSLEVKIIKMSGEVKIRHGVEEFWQPASLGIFLKDIRS